MARPRRRSTPSRRVQLRFRWPSRSDGIRSPYPRAYGPQGDSRGDAPQASVHPAERCSLWAAGDGLQEQEDADAGQREIEVFVEVVSVQETMIDDPAQIDTQKGDRQSKEVVMVDGTCPESGQPVAGHADDAGGQKIALQGGAEMWRGPTAHGAVDDERRAVHAVGAAENTGGESAAEEPGMMVAGQFPGHAAHQGVNREEHNDQGQSALDGALVMAGEKQETDGNAEQCGEDEPSGTDEVNLFPVLYDDDGGNGNGDKHGKRRGDTQRNAKREQRHGHQRFPKAEGGANQSREENDEQNVAGGRVDRGLQVRQKHDKRSGAFWAAGNGCAASRRKERRSRRQRRRLARGR